MITKPFKDLPTTVDLASIRGRIDVGIITIREDEFKAVLDCLSVDHRAVGRRHYNICRVNGRNDHCLHAAVIRSGEQGNGEAQSCAVDLLEEIRPKWLLVVGIAGSRPSSEFGPGDVVVSTRIHDFSVEAVLANGAREFNLGGGPLHPQAIAAAANIPALGQEMEGWNSAPSIGERRPRLNLEDRHLEGPEDWKKAVKTSLANQTKRKTPLVVAGPIGASDRLVRNPELLQIWLKMTRHLYAIEMESAGIYRVAHSRRIPFLAIRGISDVVGLKRNDPTWTKYACYSAASFLRAFLPTLLTPIAETIRWRIVVEGEYEDFDKSRVEAIVTKLSQKLGGARVIIERWEPWNSIAIHFKSSRKIFEQIKQLAATGELAQILNLTVLDVEQEGSGDANRSTSSWGAHGAETTVQENTQMLVDRAKSADAEILAHLWMRGEPQFGPLVQHRTKAIAQADVQMLADRAKSGDSEAFGQLWKQYEPQVKSFIGVQLGYGNNAIPDVLLEVSVKVWRNLPNFTGQAKFSTWLYSIAHRTCIDYYRRERRQENDVPLERAADLPQETTWSIAVASKLAAAEEVLLQMGELQEKIVRLVCWEQQSPTEVADTLGIKRQDVYDAVKAFRRRLRQASKGPKS